MNIREELTKQKEEALKAKAQYLAQANLAAGAAVVCDEVLAKLDAEEKAAKEAPAADKPKRKYKKRDKVLTPDLEPSASPETDAGDSSQK